MDLFSALRVKTTKKENKKDRKWTSCDFTFSLLHIQKTISDLNNSVNKTLSIKGNKTVMILL